MINANLSMVEKSLIDELTGMSSGYVLDFSNQTFAEFFQTEVGIDIYDAVYADLGPSKGKRLRCFLSRGQKMAVARALTGLWLYRENLRYAKESQTQSAMLAHD